MQGDFVEYLRNIFVYSSNKPLLFTQFYFWGFFAVVLIFYSIIYKKKAARNAFLFFASLFFYYKTSGFYFIILLFSTFSDFFIGKFIYASGKKVTKQLLLALSVFINLFVLFYFKYTEFLTDTINNIAGTDYHIKNYFSMAGNWIYNSALFDYLSSISGDTKIAAFFLDFLSYEAPSAEHFTVDKIILPVGISFFTFQTISYSVDIYKDKIKPVKSILDFGFYVSFFPQLVAGPIVRAADFVPQLYKEYKVSKAEFGLALFWILKGLIKKMYISDYISINFVDRVFETPLKYSGFENLMALYGYSLQVYADFSGYTDIAIGVALLIGFRLPTNFNSPYKAKSTGEFWKRWHISLSSWLKDYLYIPLGGNREGSVATYISLAIILGFIVLLSGWLWLAVIFYSIVLFFAILSIFSPVVKKMITTNINMMITMLLGGLWHGSSWMFVIWGGLNGIGLIVYKFWKRKSQKFRWILFFVLNLTAFITYQTDIWHNPNGLIVWLALNIVWIVSYIIWFLNHAEQTKFITIRWIISILLVLFFVQVTLVISGFWSESYGKILWLILSGLVIGAYYLFRNLINKHWIGVLLLFNFIASGALVYTEHSDAIFMIWFIISTIALLGYFFHIVKKELDGKPFLPYFWGIFLTFNFITFTRIWFRGQNMEITRKILEKIGNDWDLSLIPTMISSYKAVFVTMFIGYFIHWLSADFKEKYTNWFIKSPIWIKAFFCIIVVFFIFQIKTSDLQPFIYFQF